MKKVFGYVLAFTMGTLFSGSTVWAATNYAQALKKPSSFVLDSIQTTSAPALVYGGTTYVQLYSIEDMLRKIDLKPTWDGQSFGLSTLNPVVLTGNSTDTIVVTNDISDSISNIQQWRDYFHLRSQLDPHETKARFEDKLKMFVQYSSSDLQAISSDNPSNPQLQSLVKSYIQIVQLWAVSFQDTLNGSQTSDVSLMDQGINGVTNAQKAYESFLGTWSMYLWNVDPGAAANSTTP